MEGVHTYTHTYMHTYIHTYTDFGRQETSVF